MEKVIMNSKNFRVRLLVAALVGCLPLAAFAGTPAAGSLPGTFQSSVAATYKANGSNSATITFNSSSPQVMQWGGTPGVSTQTVNAPSGIQTNAGLDVGQGATLNIDNQAAQSGPSLLVDDTGNPSTIAGSINVTGTPEGVVIANPNGISVLNGAVISDGNGTADGFYLLGYLPNESNFITNNQLTITGTTPTNDGAMTIESGANLTGSGFFLVAGNGAVNIGSGNIPNNGNPDNHDLYVYAGVGLNIGRIITPTSSINSNSVLNITGGTTDNPILTDLAISAGGINITGALGGDPSATNNTSGSNGVLLAANTYINIAQGGTLTGSVIHMGSLGGIEGNASPSTAPNITIAGTINATQELAFDGANNVYETATGSVNISPNGALSAEIYGNLANPAGGQAHNGNWMYNGFVVNTTSGSTVGVVINPLSLGTKQQFFNVSVPNSAVNLLNDYIANGNTFPQSLAQSPINVGSSVSAQTPTVSDPSHLVLTAQNIVLGGPNSSNTSNNFYFPGLLALVTMNGNDPTTIGSGSIVTEGSVSNVVPWNIQNGGGLYFMTHNLGLRSGATVMTNMNSFVNFLPGTVFPNPSGVYYNVVNVSGTLNVGSLPNGDLNTYGAWND